MRQRDAQPATGFGAAIGSHSSLTRRALFSRIGGGFGALGLASVLADTGVLMLDGAAIIFAGASGAGKSTLALAASRAGLPLLSDDTIYVQTEPVFRLWSLAGPIHVFAKDAPDEQETGMRFRAGDGRRGHGHLRKCFR